MADEKNDTSITFTYKHSKAFRVIKVDGAWGGATPRLDIQMAVYSERLAIPDFQEFAITDEGQLAPAPNHTEHQTKGPIREVEAMMSMSIPVARSIAAWLNSKADEIEGAIQAEMKRVAMIKKEDGDKK